MTRFIRYFLILVSAIQLAFAVAFFLQSPFAINLWPFEGTTPLTYIFISSFFAAAGASTLWASVSENYGALAGISLDYLAIFAPLTVLSFQLVAGGGTSQMTFFGVACALGALFGLGLFLWSVRIPIDHSLPMPVPVRWSFVLFIIALVIVGTMLILKTPNVIPWMITPDISVLIGWMFIGAAIYFTFGILRPSWLNAAGQLIGFLAYDLVLIVPFLTRLPTAPPEFRLNLTIYTAIVIYSGLLAVYYLFIHAPTRRRTWMRTTSG
jgi:hypothetical protein